MTEDEMVGWYHRLNGHEFEQTLGNNEGQGNLGVLQSMGLQKIGHDSVTEQQQQYVFTGFFPALGLKFLLCVVFFPPCISFLFLFPNRS